MLEKNTNSKKDARSKSKKQADFLLKLSEYVSISRACRSAKVSRSTVYRWLKTDNGFKEKYQEACGEALQRLEDEATRRAFEGLAKPVYYQGKKIGTVKEFSDTLLMALLKAKSPAKYRDRPSTKNDENGFEAIPKERTTIKWGDKEILI